MGISNIISLLGGLGLFLFGMKYMSDGLNQVAGKKMKNLLEKLTRNRFKGFLLGVLVTAVIQSSSATTVMLMGFLNAGIMDLAQATGVIIGANIGTTITAVLIAIDVSAIAPFCIFIGTVMALFSKKQTQKFVGQIILGFGVLFFGLKYMSGPEAMGVLKTSAAFQAFITKANNPFLGLLIGFIMCSVLQSSSASIGVLQALAMTSASLMPMKFAIYLIIGINVGSAMPLFLSAIGAKTNAKRAAVIYLFSILWVCFYLPRLHSYSRNIPSGLQAFRITVPCRLPLHILYSRWLPPLYYCRLSNGLLSSVRLLSNLKSMIPSFALSLSIRKSATTLFQPHFKSAVRLSVWQDL